MPQVRRIRRIERIPRGIRERVSGDFNLYALSSIQHIIYTTAPYILLIPLFLLGIFLNPYFLFVMSIAFIYAILGMAWSIFAFRAGLFHLGMAFHFGLGGYITAILNVWLNLPSSISVILGSLIAALLSACVLLPTLRLRGIYFALCSLILPLLTANIIITIPQLGKEEGIIGIKPLTIGMGYYYLLVLLAIMLIFILKKVELDSYFGLRLRAIREDEWGMKAAGYNPMEYKLYACLIGGFIGSLAGGIFVTYLSLAGPALFTIDYSITPILATVIGGSVGPWCPFVGALIVIPTLEFLRLSGPLRILLISAFLAAILVLRPEGIVGFLQRKYFFKEKVQYEEVRSK